MAGCSQQLRRLCNSSNMTCTACSCFLTDNSLPQLPDCVLSTRYARFALSQAVEASLLEERPTSWAHCVCTVGARLCLSLLAHEGLQGSGWAAGDDPPPLAYVARNISFAAAGGAPGCCFEFSSLHHPLGHAHTNRTQSQSGGAHGYKSTSTCCYSD